MIRGQLTGDNRRLKRWEQRTEPYLLFLAVATIPLIAVPLIADLSATADRIIFVFDIIIWALFALDLSIRLCLAEERIRFIREHPIEVLCVVLPFLRPLRLVLAVGRLSVFLRRHSVSGSLYGAGIAIVISTTLVALVEQQADGQIQNWGTALWWALATITTVGYGDVVPVTTGGRIIGAMLMIIGIGVFGVITANVAAWFIESRDDLSNREQLDAIVEELERLRRDLQNGP